MSTSQEDTVDIMSLQNDLDSCIIGVRVLTKKRSYFEGAKRRDKRISFIDRLLNIILQNVVCDVVVFEELYISILTDLIMKRKDYPFQTIQIIFHIIAVCCSDKYMLSRYVRWCENSNKTTLIWMDQTLSAVFQCCSDENLRSDALIALYYMLYNIECFKLFRSEGCLPSLLLMVHNDQDQVSKIRPKEIMRKLVLEGGLKLLQYCSRDELLMMLNCSDLITRISGLMMMTDIMEYSVLPLFRYMKYRSDVSIIKCSLRVSTEAMRLCNVVFMRKECLLVYPIDGESVSDIPSCKIGLDNCFLFLQPESNALTFILPGAFPVTLQFENQQEFTVWKNRFQYMKVYNQYDYPYSGTNVVSPPYYNLRYRLSTESRWVPGLEELQIIKWYLLDEILIAEFYLYICKVIFLASMTPEGREYLVRLELLNKITELFLQLDLEFINQCQSDVSYQHFQKVKAEDIVLQVRTDLIGALFNLCSEPTAVQRMNATLIIGILPNLLDDPCYEGITMHILGVLYYLLASLSESDKQSQETVQQVIDSFDSVMRITKRPYTERTFYSQMFLIYLIISEMARFGEDVMWQLTNRGVLRMILQNCKNTWMNGQISQCSRDYLKSIYGSQQAPMRQLSLGELFAIANINAPHAIVRALVQIDSRLPELVEMVNKMAGDPIAMQRAVSSVPLSLRQSISSVSLLFSGSQNDESEKETVFTDDFLNHSFVYGNNRQKDIDQKISRIQESEHQSRQVTSIKRRNIETPRYSLSMASSAFDLDDREKEEFKQLTESVTVILSLLSGAIQQKYEDQNNNIIKLLGRIIAQYCMSPHLCALLFDRHVITEVFHAIQLSRRFDDDAVFSLGCALLSFFQHYQGDISNIWSLGNRQGKPVVLGILQNTIIGPYDGETRALFVLVVAVMLRCYVLRAAWYPSGYDVVYSVFQQDLPISMTATAYFFGLVAQDREICDDLLSQRTDLVDAFSNLQEYPTDTQAAMLFALQSFVLVGQGKNYIVHNVNNILNDLITLSCGHDLISDEEANPLLVSRARTILSYLFVCTEESVETLQDLSSDMLLHLISANVPLVTGCCIKMLADKLHRGCPPAMDFVYLPLKAGMAESKSSSRRSNWTSYEIYLEPDRILLYQQRDKTFKELCCKSISLENVELEQNPPEASTKGLKISSGRLSESAKFLRFGNDMDYKSWEQYISLCISARYIISTPDDVPIMLNDPARVNVPLKLDSLPPMTDYTSLHATLNSPDPKLWLHQDVLTASSLSDDNAMQLIEQLASSSLITRVHSIRALAAVFTCANHSLSEFVFSSFIQTVQAMATVAVATPPPEDFLMQQAFFYLKPNRWVCSICLCTCLDSLDVCFCCGASRVPGLESTANSTTYHQQRLLYAFNRYMYECLLVCSTNTSLCRHFSAQTLKQAVAFMKNSDMESIVICSKFIANVLHQKPNDAAILAYLQDPSLFATIRQMVQRLTPSRTTLLVLNSLVKLIGAITTYDPSIPPEFTNHNGIEILSTIFHFSLSPNQRECLVGFVRPVISFLWGDPNRIDVLSSSSIQQLMTLFLWAVEYELSNNRSEFNVGANVIDVLLSFAREKEEKGMGVHQEMLVKFGVPRLLALFGDVISYGRFRTLQAPSQRLYYCYQVLLIVRQLAQSLIPSLRHHLLNNGMPRILLVLTRSAWVPVDMRKCAVECLSLLLHNNSKAINNLLQSERSTVSDLFTLLHDKVTCITLDARLQTDEIAVIQQVFALLLDLSYVGSAVYQMTRGNVLFYILLALRSTNPPLQLQAAHLLWRIISKRCASSGSPFSQALDTPLLLKELVTVIQRTNSSDLLRLLLGVALVLSFSGERKLQLLPLCADAQRLANMVKGGLEMPKYSAVSFYQHLVGPNRDSERVLCAMRNDMLFQLAMFPDDFVRFSVLSELRFRLMRLILPPESAMPPDYEHVKVQLRCRGREQLAEAYLTPTSLYLFGSSSSEKVLFPLLGVHWKDAEVQLLNPQQNGVVCLLRFSDAKLAETWVQHIRERSIESRLDLRSRLGLMQSVRSGQSGVDHPHLLMNPLMTLLEQAEIGRLENIAKEMNSSNEQLGLLASSILEIVAFFRTCSSGSVLASPAVHEIIRSCDLEKEVVMDKKHWSVLMPAPPAPKPSVVYEPRSIVCYTKQGKEI